jgi:tRNA pseudouridine38-40 synthase
MTRRVRAVRIRAADQRLRFEVVADSFCHQMVRSIVGTLLDVGARRLEPADVKAALESGDRARAGRVAPAKGLHLMRVVYRPDPFAVA